MSAPYLPLYIDDYEAATAHLTLIEDGIYMRLLRLCWRTPGCSVPDDEAWIFRRLRAHSDEERDAVRAIVDEFFERKSGRIFQPRLMREFDKLDETYRKRSEAGKKGGRQKVSENKRKEQKAGLSNDKAGPKQPEPEPEPAASQPRARARGAEKSEPTHRERLLAAAGADPASGMIGPNGVQLGKVSDMAAAERWSEMGLSVDRQCAVIREVIQRKQDKDPFFVPRSFGYFDGPMQEAAQAASGQGRAGRSVEDAQTAFLRRVAGGNGG